MTCLLHCPAPQPETIEVVTALDDVKRLPWSKNEKNFFTNLIKDYFCSMGLHHSWILMMNLFQNYGLERGIQLIFDNFTLPKTASLSAESLDYLSWGMTAGGLRYIPLFRKIFDHSQQKEPAKLLAFLTLEKMLPPASFLEFALQAIKKNPSSFFKNLWVEKVIRNIQNETEYNQFALTFWQQFSKEDEIKNTLLKSLIEGGLKNGWRVDYDLYQNVIGTPVETFTQISDDPRCQKDLLEFYVHTPRRLPQHLANIITQGWEDKIPLNSSTFIYAFNEVEDEKQLSIILNFLKRPENQKLRGKVEKHLFNQTYLPLTENRTIYRFLQQTPEPIKTLERLKKTIEQKNLANKNSYSMLLALQGQLARRCGQTAEAERISRKFWQENFFTEEPTLIQIKQAPVLMGDYLLDEPVLAQHLQDAIITCPPYDKRQKIFLEMSLHSEKPEFLSLVANFPRLIQADVIFAFDFEKDSHLTIIKQNLLAEQNLPMVEKVFTAALLNKINSLISKQQFNSTHLGELRSKISPLLEVIGVVPLAGHITLYRKFLTAAGSLGQPNLIPLLKNQQFTCAGLFDGKELKTPFGGDLYGCVKKIKRNHLYFSK